MKVDITEHTGPMDIPVVLGESESFTLKVRRPTFRDRITDMEFEVLKATKAKDAATSHWDFRLGFVRGWDGVEDMDGKPIPFSIDALKAAMTNREDIAWAVGGALRSVFRSPVDKDTEKNLNSPLGSGSQGGEQDS